MGRIKLLQDLALRIDRLAPGHPVRVAIDGIDAAGKTILADELAEHLTALGRSVIRASIDGFHHPAPVRHRLGSLSPEGYYLDSFAYDSIIDKLLRPLGPGGDRHCQTTAFDYRADSAIDAATLEPPADAILLFDGVFLLRPELRAYWDFAVFLRVDFAVAIARAEQRDRDLFGAVEQVRERYARRYVPGQQLYFSAAAPESQADVIIDNNDPAAPFVVQ